jgi:hypothetical protein
MMNLVELDKLNVEVSVQGTNLNVLKGDKIPIVLIKNDIVENILVLKEGYNEAVDFFYSGWFLVKGFSLDYENNTDNDSGLSNFFQTFILTRREWPTPIPIEPITVNDNPFKLQ